MNGKKTKVFKAVYKISLEEAKEVEEILTNLPHGYAIKLADSNACSPQVIRNVRAGIKCDPKVLSELIELAKPYYRKKKEMFNL